MVGFAELWLPIVLSAAIVTVAAVLMWRVLPHHRSAASARPAASFGSSVVMFFVFALVVSLTAAYVAGRTLEPGTEYFQVFRVAGTVALFSYAAGHIASAIWGTRTWDGALREAFDGVVYGLLTAGTFGGFWPGS